MGLFGRRTEDEDRPVVVRPPAINCNGCFGILVFLLIGFYLFFEYVMSKR